MSIAQSMLAELDHEMKNTRRALERVPADRFTWAPHAKSFPLWKLAFHVADQGRWVYNTCTLTELDLAAMPPWPQPASTADLLARHDEWWAKGREALAAMSDEAMQAQWTLRSGEHVLFTMSRAQVIRHAIINHMIHHRGQLTVYLRLLDVSVPGLFGPSADER